MHCVCVCGMSFIVFIPALALVMGEMCVVWRGNVCGMGRECVCILVSIIMGRM